MLDYKFDPKAVYLVAVTYGPDSMALLDMMQNEGGEARRLLRELSRFQRCER